MKKLATMFLVYVLSLALFIPAGCGSGMATDPVPVPPPPYHGEKEKFFDFEDLVCKGNKKFSFSEKLGELINLIYGLDNDTPSEALYPSYFEVTLKKTQTYPVLTLRELLGYVTGKYNEKVDREFDAKMETANEKIKEFRYLYITPEDVPEDDRYEGYEVDFRQKVIITPNNPTKYEILDVLSFIAESLLVKDIDIIFV